MPGLRGFINTQDRKVPPLRFAPVAVTFVKLGSDRVDVCRGFAPVGITPLSFAPPDGRGRPSLHQARLMKRSEAEFIQ